MYPLYLSHISSNISEKILSTGLQFINSFKRLSRFDFPRVFVVEATLQNLNQLHVTTFPAIVCVAYIPYDDFLEGRENINYTYSISVLGVSIFGG